MTIETTTNDPTDGTTDGRLQEPEGARGRIAAGFGSCQVDMAALLLSQLDSGTSIEVRTCVAQGLDRAIADDAMVAQLLGGADALDAVTRLYEHFTEVGAFCSGGD